MKKYIPVLVLLTFLSQSCIMGQNKSEVFLAGKIDPKVKTALSALNDQVFKHMSDNNYDALAAMFSDTLRTMINGDFERKFMPAMQSIMKGRQYRIYDEIYIRNTRKDDTFNISSGKGDEAFSLKFSAPANEVYIALLVAGDSVNEVMMTLTYGSFKGKWQLTGITGEDYSLNKRNALAHYHYAAELEKKTYFMDAVNVMGMANHCIKPGGRMFTFKKDKEIRIYSDTLTSKAKARYPFPYTVKELTTKPLVVNVHYELEAGEFVPMIVYQSVINVADTGSLRKENNEMQRNIGKIFAGMDKVNKHLFYRVYNELPNGQNQPAYYGYVQKL